MLISKIIFLKDIRTRGQGWNTSQSLSFFHFPALTPYPFLTIGNGTVTIENIKLKE
jgi:hypothetical protein